MTTKRLLITGATGSTGRNAVETLIRAGFAVRAVVHGEDERAAHLRALGAEVVVADLLSLYDARHVLEGVDYLRLNEDALAAHDGDGLFRIATNSR